MNYSGSDEGFVDFLVESPSGLTTGETGMLGVTVLPNRGESGVNSLDGSQITINVNKHLSLLGRAEMYSHEANGHAWLFVFTGDRAQAAHDYVGMWDANGWLRFLILGSRKETLRNFYMY